MPTCAVTLRERHMAESPGSCTVRIKTKEGKDYIARPANNNFTGKDSVNLQAWVKKVYDPNVLMMVEGADCEKIPDENTCTTDDRATKTGCVWTGNSCVSPNNLDSKQIEKVVQDAQQPNQRGSGCFK